MTTYSYNINFSDEEKDDFKKILNAIINKTYEYHKLKSFKNNIDEIINDLDKKTYRITLDFLGLDEQEVRKKYTLEDLSKSQIKCLVHIENDFLSVPDFNKKFNLNIKKTVLDSIIYKIQNFEHELKSFITFN